MAEDMEMSSRYEETDYEEYGEEAEARIEPFRRRRKPYRFLNLAQSIVDNVEQEEKEAEAHPEPGLLQRGLHGSGLWLRRTPTKLRFPRLCRIVSQLFWVRTNQWSDK